MPSREPQTHTFLLRIWVEETLEESGRLVWRGQVTHLPDECQQYVASFDEIRRFISLYLPGEDHPSGPDASGP